MSEVAAVDTGAQPSAPEVQTVSTSEQVSSVDSSQLSTVDTSTANVSSSQGEPSPEPAPSPTAPEGWTLRDGEWYFKARVYGEDVELPYERAISMIRQGEASTRAWQEAKRIERQTEELFASINDPRAAADLLRRLGHDPRSFAEAWMSEHIEESRLTPEQRQLREYQQRVAELERREQERERAQYEARQTQYQQQQREAYVKAFDAELDGLSARKTPEARSWQHQRMAQLIQHCEQNGIPTTLKEIARKAHADFERLVGPAPAPTPPAPQPAPPKPVPKVTVPPEEQQVPRHDTRDPRGRFAPKHDPKPAFDPANPESVKAIYEWSQRNKRR